MAECSLLLLGPETVKATCAHIDELLASPDLYTNQLEGCWGHPVPYDHARFVADSLGQYPSESAKLREISFLSRYLYDSFFPRQPDYKTLGFGVNFGLEFLSRPPRSARDEEVPEHLRIFQNKKRHRLSLSVYSSAFLLDRSKLIPTLTAAGIPSRMAQDVWLLNQFTSPYLSSAHPQGTQFPLWTVRGWDAFAGYLTYADFEVLLEPRPDSYLQVFREAAAKWGDPHDSPLETLDEFLKVGAEIRSLGPGALCINLFA